MIDKAEIERALLTVRDQSTFINNLLVDTLHWPIEGNVANVEEITYNWSAAELRTLDLEKRLVDGEVRQIANLDPKQPWGIFILEFKNPDAFIAERGMTGTLRKVLRGLRCWHNGGRDRAKNIRYALESLEEKVRAEQEHGPLSPSEVIGMKASRFIHASEPLVFDAMNPQQKALWSRRLLRVVWILTDTADLAATKLEWLREWGWGNDPLEFLGGWPIPRLWSRTTVLDRDLEEWERLTRDALRALEDAEPGATTLPTQAGLVDVATTNGKASGVASAEGHFSPAEPPDDFSDPRSFARWLEKKMPVGIDQYCGYTSGYDPHTHVKREAYRIARHQAALWGFAAPPSEPAGLIDTGVDLCHALDQLRVWTEDSIANAELEVEVFTAPAIPAVVARTAVDDLPDAGAAELAIAIERDLYDRTDLYREAIAWWNDKYACKPYRNRLADGIRAQGQRSGRGGDKSPTGEADHNSYSYLARVGDAMGLFPKNKDKWRQIGIEDASRILLITAIITRPDLDAARIDLEEPTQWGKGGIINGNERFGREWGDGSFTEWDDGHRENGLWMDLAAIAWKVMQNHPDRAKPPAATAPLTTIPIKFKRRGRLRKEDSEARRAALMATIRQHPSFRDDPARLADDVGVSESTARRWLNEEEQKYLESKAAQPRGESEE